MTISISSQAIDDLFQEVEPTRHPDPEDTLDSMGQYPTFFAQGYWRTIQLRDGLRLGIGNLRMRDRFLVDYLGGTAGGVEFHLHFSGAHQDRYQAIGAGQYGISGSGSILKHRIDYLDRQPYLEVTVWMRADMLRSFMGDPDGQLPLALLHLTRSVEQEPYNRVGTATPAMQTIARQILRCPRRGIAKRIYIDNFHKSLFNTPEEEKSE
jgi:hypothetical protein